MIIRVCTRPYIFKMGIILRPQLPKIAFAAKPNAYVKGVCQKGVCPESEVQGALAY